MEQFISPIVLYLACVLGAAGVALALPRRGANLARLGAVFFAGAVGLAAVSLAARASSGQGLFFYLFAAIALASAFRVVTHPRPVYSALYFILTIVASCGMYLLLGAEFMAFALIIIYAGAILITYLFVIMLATQTDTGTGADERLRTEVDTVSREPVVGAILGFVLLGLVTTMTFEGVGSLAPPADFEPDAVLANLPVKADRALRQADLIEPYESVHRVDGLGSIDFEARTIEVFNERTGTTRVIGPDSWPEGLAATNLDRLGWNLLHDHPMTIEITGIILLMAMVGATVLARRHVQLEDELKAEQARRLGAPRAGGAVS